MIVKMKFLSITGPKNDIERMAGQYLSKYEIQLENALTELKTVRDLRYTGFWSSGISNIVSAGFQKSILTNLSGMSMIHWIRFSINAAAMRSMCGACILYLLLWRTR